MNTYSTFYLLFIWLICFLAFIISTSCSTTNTECFYTYQEEKTEKQNTQNLITYPTSTTPSKLQELNVSKNVNVSINDFEKKPQMKLTSCRKSGVNIHRFKSLQKFYTQLSQKNNFKATR